MNLPRMPFFLFGLAALLLAAPLRAQESDAAADSTGLPGDNFSLEGALELFKKSESLEAFEKALNTDENLVNNLDLNEDGETDYVRIIDHMDGDVHAIVLQVPISESESQDVAVIEIEKTGTESAELQILGDEDVYGAQVIAEPYEAETVKGKRGGPMTAQPPVALVVNVWAWPAVRFVYAPRYVVYASPWGWRRYPGWYRPFRPHPWRVVHVRVAPFRAHYRVAPTHRMVRAHRVYVPVRKHSTVVHTRTTKVYRGPNGGKVKATKTTTTVRGKNGRVKQRHSTTSVKRGRRH